MKPINSNHKNFDLSRFFVFKIACIFLLSIDVFGTTELEEVEDIGIHSLDDYRIVNKTKIIEKLAANKNGRRHVHS